jgi:light-regulated signal transduction histidine kinase (bacteriophytochrome)
LPVSDLLSKPYLEFIHPDDVARTRSAAATSSTTGIVAFENRYRTREGGYRWLNWNSSPDAQRGLIYAAARDVTETKAARETLEQLNTELEARARRLEETNRELEAFTSSVAHDLRAPLRHVDGFSRILEEEHSAALSPEGKQLIERVRRATQHMGELVDDLLNLSRVSRREVAPVVTDLNPLVREVIAELKSACQGRRVEFRVGALPFAECDPRLIRQVFANLLANAVKFTRPRDPAIIEVGQSDYNGSRAIFVRDNGVGFSMKYADKLFGVFQRLHRPEDFEGTGVGLVTVQRIIQKHNGRIWAEAEVDRGAAFFFTVEGLEDRRSADSARSPGELHARI